MIPLRASLLLGLLAALGGCQPRTIPYQVRLITQSCEPSVKPLDGVTHLRFRVTGEDLAPLEQTVPVSLGEASIPEIPAGPGRQVEVRAYAGDPAGGGALVSLGRTAPFDVPDVLPKDAPPQPEVPVFLRKVNAFTPTASVEKPGTCTRMRDARAAHSATLLPDGRVYIAGGYQLQNGKRLAISKAELFNPLLGDFSQAQEVGFVSPNNIVYPSARAFHTATALNSGQVLLVGGESYTERGDAVATKVGLIYDAEFNDYGVFAMLSERTRHTAAKEVGGRVLIAGGLNKDGQVLGELEWYDPSAGKTAAVSDGAGGTLKLPRVGHSSAAVQDGSFVAVAGGSNGTALQDEVFIFQFDTAQNRFVSAAATNPRLREKRRAAAMVPFHDLSRLILAGGFDGPTEAGGNPVATTEVVELGQALRVGDGPTVASARGEICAARLPDGRVITIGGLINDSVAGTRSDSTVELIAHSASGQATSLRMDPLGTGRHFLSCTTLKDGSVLVLGGIEVKAGQSTILQDALIFTPAPLD